MKTALGQHLPDLWIPESAGGKFPKTSKRKAARKVYICMTTAGLQLVTMPYLKTANGETTAEAPMAHESKWGIQQVLAGPFYPETKEEKNQLWKEYSGVAAQRQRNWRISMSKDETRDAQGMSKAVVYERTVTGGKKTDSEWAMKGDPDFE